MTINRFKRLFAIILFFAIGIPATAQQQTTAAQKPVENQGEPTTEMIPGGKVFGNDKTADSSEEPVKTKEELTEVADYPDGINAFYKYVGNNFKVPEEEGLSGKIIATFVIEKDGSLTDIKIVQDIGFGTAEETIRVLSASKKWIPAKIEGKPVRSLYSLPITIRSAN